MMVAGDSAAFMNSADSFFTKIVHGELPPQIKKGSFLKFCFKMEKIEGKADVEKKQAEDQKKQAEANSVRMAEEKSIIEKYVADNKITVKPSASGLYFMEKHKGSGEKIVAGDTVYVKYTGKTLDGKVFDSSDRSPVPVKFQIGVGQVIKGWDEAVTKMNVGGKISILLPSSLAYGDRGAGEQIPPFSPLLFDVEVYKVGKK
jgi:FKBP-type peptidyl-prolyl cis-trans isomerase